MDIKIQVDDAQVRQALSHLAQAGGDMSPAMREIAATLADAAERAFDTEANPATGEPWTPLAPSTVRQRQRRGKWPGKMLQVSQAGLANSIQEESGKNYAIAGTNKIYGPVQHFGVGRRTSLKSRREMPAIPARPFLGVSPEDEDEFLRILRRHLAP